MSEYFILLWCEYFFKSQLVSSYGELYNLKFEKKSLHRTLKYPDMLIMLFNAPGLFGWNPPPTRLPACPSRLSNSPLINFFLMTDHQSWLMRMTTRLWKRSKLKFTHLIAAISSLTTGSYRVSNLKMFFLKVTNTVRIFGSC